MLFQQVRKLQENEVNKYLNRNSPFSGIWDSIITQDGEQLPEETRRLITEYYYPRLHRLFADQKGSPNTFILPANKTFITAHLQPVHLSDEAMKPAFLIEKNHETLEMHIKADNGIFSSLLKDNESPSPLLYMNNERIFLWENVADVFEIENLKVQLDSLPENKSFTEVLKEVALPLAGKYKLHFNRRIVKDMLNSTPSYRILME